MLQEPQNTESAAEQYLKRRDRYSGEATALEQSSRRYSNLRLFVFLLTLIIPIATFNGGYLLAAATALFTGIVLFFALIVRHGVIIDRLDAAKRLVEINQQGLNRVGGEWTTHKHQGIEFLDRSHPYSTDLDIFGPNSVFQWICAAHSPQGQKRLAESLTRPAVLNELPLRQEAVLELAGKLDWRQQFEQMTMGMEKRSWDSLLAWAESAPSPSFPDRTAKYLRYLPLLALITGGFGYIAGLGLIPITLLLLVQMVVASGLARSLRPHITLLEKHQQSLGALETALTVVEKEAFTAELSRKLQSSICTGDYSATEEISTLRATAGWLQMRNNPPVHFVLNVLFLWDFQWVARAESWRIRNGGRIRTWLSSLAEFEALGSLAIIPFENPEWPLPKIAEHPKVYFGAEDLGHPLLSSKVRVSNNLEIPRVGMVCLVTGSNMSGKSTFLRSVGVNLVLAFAGAPVCAGTFTCAYMPLYSSMRVTDDLNAGVSSFYAELLRVKTIIDASRKQPVYCLIDEIFRGTNSKDRLAGAKEVLRALVTADAIGLVSTHDLELSQLAEREPEHFRNYHFSEHYTDQGIVFDYRMQPGESKTTNAVFLMKQLGIMQS